MAVLYASVSVLNLMRAATRSQCRETRSDMGPFGFAVFVFKYLYYNYLCVLCGLIFTDVT